MVTYVMFAESQGSLMNKDYDIIDRLQIAADFTRPARVEVKPELLDAAREEIEELRRALNDIWAWAGENDGRLCMDIRSRCKGVLEKTNG